MEAVVAGIAIALTALVLGVLWKLRGQPAWVPLTPARFAERFPPLSDAEFLARCRPGVDPAVALKVRRVVAGHFGIEYARVHPSMTFVGDIGAD